VRVATTDAFLDLRSEPKPYIETAEHPVPRPPGLMLPERFHRLRSVLDRRQPDLTVVMDRVHKEHNLSAILRNCDAVGVLSVHAVVPEGGLTLHHDTSGGTSKWMRVREHPGIGEALDALGRDGFQVVAAHPSDTAVDYREVDYTLPTALLMGAERFGVSEAALARADVTAVIPMVGMVRSLNVSVATSLFLFEAYRQREAAGMYEESRLPRDTYDRILFEWAYPEFAERFQEAGEPYPGLGADGEFLGSPLPGAERV
jgi:tRNA (guanosine-2'-O-)-methyltransferase